MLDAYMECKWHLILIFMFLFYFWHKIPPICGHILTVLTCCKLLQTVTCHLCVLAFVTPANSLFTLSLQQKVAAKAALTLVPNTIVLTVHTYSIILSRALCYPVDDLKETCNRVTATSR